MRYLAELCDWSILYSSYGNPVEKGGKDLEILVTVIGAGFGTLMVGGTLSVWKISTGRPSFMSIITYRDFRDIVPTFLQLPPVGSFGVRFS
jgi:hypothetical protein